MSEAQAIVDRAEARSVGTADRLASMAVRSAAIVEAVVMQGDLAKLTPAQRVQYYGRVCESLGLNPLTRPFDYIVLNGKLALYAKRDATDQLRKIHGVNIAITARDLMGDVYAVTARATTSDGRADESIGAVAVGGLKGEALANAYMKAETKAKRRATLSIVGLGWLDESETGSIAEAGQRRVDYETGEVLDEPAPSRTSQTPSSEPKPASERQASFLASLLRKHHVTKRLGTAVLEACAANGTKARAAIDALQRDQVDWSRLLGAIGLPALATQAPAAQPQPAAPQTTAESAPPDDGDPLDELIAEAERLAEGAGMDADTRDGYIARMVTLEAAQAVLQEMREAAVPVPF